MFKGKDDYVGEVKNKIYMYTFIAEDGQEAAIGVVGPGVEHELGRNTRQMIIRVTSGRMTINGTIYYRNKEACIAKAGEPCVISVIKTATFICHYR